MLSRGILLLIALITLSVTLSLIQESVPTLVISGFTWAENLAFDGLGNLFVSENIRGELWKINLCKNGTDYCSVVKLNEGFSSFGGLQISPDGKTLYAGATLDDGTFLVIKTDTDSENLASYSILSKTRKQPNGMACNWKTNTLYYTNEGDKGILMSIDLASGVESTLYTGLPGADGAWLDESTNLLFVGLLTEKKIAVFNLTNAVESPSFFWGTFPGLSLALDATHMLDDFTPLSGVNKMALGSTLILGADWLGSELQQFNLDGTVVASIPPPVGIEKFYQLTSARWGKGPGFDSNSIYVTEGGGMFAKQTDRRVIQIPMTKK